VHAQGSINPAHNHRNARPQTPTKDAIADKARATGNPYKVHPPKKRTSHCPRSRRMGPEREGQERPQEKPTQNPKWSTAQLTKPILRARDPGHPHPVNPYDGSWQPPAPRTQPTPGGEDATNRTVRTQPPRRRRGGGKGEVMARGRGGAHLGGREADGGPPLHGSPARRGGRGRRAARNRGLGRWESVEEGRERLPTSQPKEARRNYSNGYAGGYAGEQVTKGLGKMRGGAGAREEQCSGSLEVAAWSHRIYAGLGARVGR
jgi:hypothetical protein